MNSYYFSGDRFNIRQDTRARIALTLLLLLTTMMVVSATTTTLQTIGGTPQQNNNHGNPTREGSPPAGTYWAKTYGGGNYGYAYSIQNTSDQGYVVAGLRTSDSEDVWVLKLNSAGWVTWQKTYGGTGFDRAYSVRQTADNGYIVAGYTDSFGAGLYDVWVLKLDSAGSVTWQNAYGGGGNDFATSVQQTSDGGYIVAGSTYSWGNFSNFWVLKLDSLGSLTWNRTYGAYNYELAQSVQQTSDGGYIVAGYTFPYGGDSDVWVLKLDSTGFLTWQQTYGGSGDDEAYSVQQTSDDGYIIAGYTESSGAGQSDVWVLKLDSAGSVIWQKTYGGTFDDEAHSVQQTSVNGYIVTGYTMSFGAGSDDFWVLKLDSAGSVTWQNAYGGYNGEDAYSVRQTADGGYIVAGLTQSFGGFDVWVVKLWVDGDIVWNPSSSASTTTTSVTPADSSATPSATHLNPGWCNTTTITGTTATPQDTNAKIKEQSSGETTPPATILDLTTSNTTLNSINLTWTAPGDDGMKGNATGYVVKYSTSGSINAANWGSATTYTQTWKPVKNSTAETRTVSGLSIGTTYWFAVEAYDEVPNYGSVSNSPSRTTRGSLTIDRPSNITYVFGATGNAITWHPTSEMPDYYTISVNEGMPTSHSWDGGAITFNVDGFSVGTHNVTCMVVDTFARAVSSTVKVTVTAQPSSTGEGIEIIAVAGGAALVVVLVVAIVVMKKRKK